MSAESTMQRGRLSAELAALDASRSLGLAPYFCAGDGGLERTAALLRAAKCAGASCVELGLPAADPIADGPVLQAAHERALSAGTTRRDVLSLVRELRADGCELPVILMAYASSLFGPGAEAFFAEAAESGCDAVLIPDLALEEAPPLWRIARARGLETVGFAAPNAGLDRWLAAARDNALLYAVGRAGVTGRATHLDGSLGERCANFTDQGATPLCVGFGLRSREQLEALGDSVRLAAIGTALVPLYLDTDSIPTGAARVVDFLQSLRPGTQADSTRP
ncbi:MAG: tryptophan synthase subunit alpha [Planctomycetota bacterium]|jgi:tryptophan synthase alpha chain